MFVGSHGDLLGAVAVTDYLPRLGVFTLGLPRGLEQLLEYTFKVSAVLALINMAPVIYFDGQAALDNLILPIGGRLGDDRSLNRVRWLRRARRWLLAAGTCSLVTVISVHALQLLNVDQLLRFGLSFLRRAVPYVRRKFMS